MRRRIHLDSSDLTELSHANRPLCSSPSVAIPARSPALIAASLPSFCAAAAMAHKRAPVHADQDRQLAREENHHLRRERRERSYDKFRLGLLSSFRRSDYENTRELLEGVLQRALTRRWWVHLEREQRRAVWMWMIDLHKAMGKLYEGDLISVRPAPELEIQEGSKVCRPFTPKSFRLLTGSFSTPMSSAKPTRLCMYWLSRYATRCACRSCPSPFFPVDLLVPRWSSTTTTRQRLRTAAPGGHCPSPRRPRTFARSGAGRRDGTEQRRRPGRRARRSE